MYPPLPTPPPPEQGQTPEEYAAVLLRFVMATGCTCTLSPAQLTQAWYASQRAITARHVDPVAVAALYQARQLITLSQRHRAQLDAQAPAQAPQPPASQPPDSRKGKPAPLVPPTPTRPPSPSYADARPTLNDQPAYAGRMDF